MIGDTDNFERLEAGMEAAGMAWWEMELPGGAVFFSPNKTKMLGYESKDFFHYTKFTDLLHPDDHAQAMKAMMDHVEGKADIYETTYRIKAKDGSYKTFYDRGKITFRNKGEVRISGMVLDVTSIEKFAK